MARCLSVLLRPQRLPSILRWSFFSRPALFFFFFFLRTFVLVVSHFRFFVQSTQIPRKLFLVQCPFFHFFIWRSVSVQEIFNTRPGRLLHTSVVFDAFLLPQDGLIEFVINTIFFFSEHLLGSGCSYVISFPSTYRSNEHFPRRESNPTPHVYTSRVDNVPKV